MVTAVKAVEKLKQSQILDEAIVQHRGSSKQGISERLFSLAFRGLVYAQIWEDPVVDMEALAITPDCHVLTIASGGCNMLSYLTADPAKITVVDLNAAHVALNRLKIAALQRLPDHATFYRFVGEANDTANIAAYDSYIRPALDAESRSYWESKGAGGRRRIRGFARDIYRCGLLGRFISSAHIAARLYGIKLTELGAAQSIEDQRRFFDEKLSPVFDRKLLRWLCSQSFSLFGLGIPPAQYKALAGGQHMADVLRQRTEKLACDFAIQDNYFAQQAFGRGYRGTPGAALPPYLMAENFKTVRERSHRVDVHQANFIDHLAASPAQSLDRYVLLDAQDWMTDAQLNQLWSEITRTAKPGARVLFRTAAKPSLLPGRVSGDLLDRWEYRVADSFHYTARDRSAIYGGVHLYCLK